MPQNIRYRFLDRGTSGFDIKHRTSQSVIYDLPFGKGRRFGISNSFANAIFGGWQVNGILTVQSGLPFTPTLATSVSNAGGSRPDRLTPAKLRIRPSRIGLILRSTQRARLGRRHVSIRMATAGGILYAGLDERTWIFSAFKVVPVTERFQLQFRGEFFNIFNHPQFDLPNATIGSAAAGVISSTVGSPRDIQLSLRLTF